MNAIEVWLDERSLTIASALFYTGLVLGGAGVSMRFAAGSAMRKLGSLVGIVGVALIGGSLPGFENGLATVVFGLMAAIAVIGSAAAVTSRSPVYAAIWFAVSLLGTAGLLLLQQAYFLGVATVVVYAGAIVVTFLFVLMLAQPEGNADYDRISWAGFAAPMSVIAVALLIGVIGSSLPTFAGTTQPTEVLNDGVLHEEHVAKLGSELFARHLVSVEIVGTILLVALVGAIVIVIQGKPDRRAASPQPSPEGRGSQPGGSP